MGQGDIDAQNENYKEPVGTDFAFGSWRNQLITEETIDEKASKGGDTEFLTGPTVTVSTETSGTSADNFVFTGDIEDSYAQILSLSYELTGGNTDSGLITSGNFLRRTSPPFGGTWRLPVSPISVGQTGLFIRGKNVRLRKGPWAFGTITRTPTAGPVVPCSCTVYEDFLTAAGVTWVEAGDPTMGQFTPNGYYHDQNEIGNVSVQGQFDIGGDFDICCEVKFTLIGGGITSNTGFNFELYEGVKGGAIASIQLEGDGVGGMQFTLTGNGVWDKGAFGSIVVDTTYILRYARTGTTLRAWVWNPITEQFEWDGDPAGAVDSGTWDIDPSPWFTWFDNNPGGGDLTQGYTEHFCINAGSKI